MTNTQPQQTGTGGRELRECLNCNGWGYDQLYEKPGAVGEHCHVEFDKP